jgi:hypothetical protein
MFNVIWMDTNCCIDIGMLVCKLADRRAGRQVKARYNNTHYPGLPRSVDHIGAILVNAIKVQVAVRID